MPEKYSQPYQGKVKPDIANFFGMIANIDENMARLDAMLKESGLYDNTLLIFMTDNGGTVGVPDLECGNAGRQDPVLRRRTPRALLRPLAGRRVAAAGRRRRI